MTHEDEHRNRIPAMLTPILRRGRVIGFLAEAPTLSSDLIGRGRTPQEALEKLRTAVIDLLSWASVSHCGYG